MSCCFPFSLRSCVIIHIKEENSEATTSGKCEMERFATLNFFLLFCSHNISHSLSHYQYALRRIISWEKQRTMTTMWRDERSKKKISPSFYFVWVAKKIKKRFSQEDSHRLLSCRLKNYVKLASAVHSWGFYAFWSIFFPLSTKCEHEYENKVIFIADIISRVW